jgi:hypothetical protein
MRPAEVLEQNIELRWAQLRAVECTLSGVFIQPARERSHHVGTFHHGH